MPSSIHPRGCLTYMLGPVEAIVRSVLDLFGNQHRYVVPAYQRPYVWTEERQWAPIWDDVERIADARLAEENEHHFLGAVVIRQEKSPPGGITEWSVIDGQQRLTTIQIMLSAIAASANKDGCPDETQRIEKLLHHDQISASGDERFKFWPTTANRDAFREVMVEGGPVDEFDDDESNTIHEAWTYFFHKAGEYTHAEFAEESFVRVRYAALREAITGLLQIVTISLEKDDPAQVIFETLNARGTPLFAMDLVKNALFEAAANQGVPIETIHDTVWQKELGDTEYWSTETRLGRITVPRSESFLMHWLAMQLGETVQADEIFETFRRRILNREDIDALQLIKELNDDAAIMRSFESFPAGSPEGRFFQTLAAVDTTTMHPVALLVFRSGLPQERRIKAMKAIESFLLRRMILGMTSKGYNQLAARLVNRARGNLEAADEMIVDELASSQSDTTRWPLDAEVERRLTTKGLYGWINQKRIVLILSEIEKAKRVGKVEEITELPAKLQIEHLMPQSWHANWPLADSTEEAIARREELVDFLGNLTLVAGPLNASMSNGAWSDKLQALNENSLLMVNKELTQLAEWDEAAIEQRGRELVAEIEQIWQGPQHFMPPDWVAPEAEYRAENAQMETDDIAAVFEQGSDLLRNMLLELAKTPGERRTFAEVEDAIGWQRGRLASVCGGYGSKFNRTFDDKRPWHLHLDADGAWRIWMDEERATLVLSLAPLAGGFDWSAVDAVVNSIPPGSWTSYGDLAEIANTSAQAAANHVAHEPSLAVAYRVLNSNGSLSPHFQWNDESDIRDPIELLKAEGVEFDENDHASQDQRLSASQLAELSGTTVAP